MQTEILSEKRMESKNKKLVNLTLVSIIADVAVYILVSLFCVIFTNINIGYTGPVITVADAISIFAGFVWPVINIVLSIIAIVSSAKTNKSNLIMSIVELCVSVGGPILLGLCALLGALDPGV